MSSNGSGQTPDLASVLRTLAALAPQQSQNPQPQQDSQGRPIALHAARTSNLPTVPHDHGSHQELKGYAEANPAPQHRSSNFSRQQHYPPENSTTIAINPATIIDWPKGLRFVTNFAGLNSNLKAALSKIIGEQEKHENMWWRGRQAILEKHGNPLAEEMSDTVLAELTQYDLKVHTACSGMVTGMTEELKLLGIPFFGTRPDLVLSSDQNTEQSGKKITHQELQKLQQRMLQHLEDMYKD